MATHKEKEQEKLKLLYDIYEQPMYRIAYAILHHTEQAEDAVSDPEKSEKDRRRSQ